MTDDIANRLREGALSGDLPLGAGFNWDQVAGEIERLRAENERLQGLIDAYAVEFRAGVDAFNNGNQSDDDQKARLYFVREALLAAATKEEDNRAE